MVPGLGWNELFVGGSKKLNGPQLFVVTSVL
jgi:hypothetical protein